MHLTKGNFDGQDISVFGLGVTGVISLVAFRMLGKTLGLLLKKLSEK